jgi:hypothetical protein
MAKKRKTKARTNQKKSFTELSLGLWAVVILFFLAALSSASLILQRILIILTAEFRPGVIISLFIFLVYFIFLLISISLILNKHKDAVKTSIITMVWAIISAFWYRYFGQIIFYTGADKSTVVMNGLIMFILNSLIAIFIIFYLKSLKKIEK